MNRRTLLIGAKRARRSGGSRPCGPRPGQVPVPADQARHSFPAGRPDRHAGPTLWREALGAARPAGRDRQQGGRRRHGRGRPRRQVQARRLHDAARLVLDTGHRPLADAERALRSGEGLHAVHHRLRAHGDFLQSRAARPHAAGVRGAAEGQSRQVSLRLVRHGQHRPSGQRALQAQGRRPRLAARALQGQQPGRAGRTVGRGRLAVRHDRHDVRPLQGRQAALSRGLRREAHGRRARAADHRRMRPARRAGLDRQSGRPAGRRAGRRREHDRRGHAPDHGRRDACRPSCAPCRSSRSPMPTR